MSAVVVRMLFAGGIALAVAAFALFKARSQNNGHQNESRGSGRRPERTYDHDHHNSWHTSTENERRSGRSTDKKQGNSGRDWPGESDDDQRTERLSRRGRARKSNQGRFECKICYCEYSEILDAGDEVWSTACGHLFCKKCITQLISFSGLSAACPLCRKDISKESLSRVFLE